MKNTFENSISILTVSVATFLGCATYASAATRLDHSLFQGLSFVEESLKRISMEGKIEESHGSSALREGRIEILGNVVDTVSTTTKGQYYYKDVEVIGAMALTHQSGAKIESEQFITPISMDVTPRLSARQAFLIAKSFTGNNPMRMAPTLKILPNIDRTDATLVYVIDFASKGLVTGSEITVNANTGRIVSNLSHVETIAPITIYNTGKSRKIFIQPMLKTDPRTGQPMEVGCLTLDPVSGVQGGGPGVTCDSIVEKDIANKSVCQYLSTRNVDPKDIKAMPLLSLPEGCDLQVKAGAWQTTNHDVSVTRAFENSKKVAEYFLNVHGRDSYDDKGGEIVSYVNAGIRMANASWNTESNEMTYGGGDGVEYDNFSKAIDIAGHEMTHGIVSKTAGLLMEDENGALNEAIADFFGKMIEGKDAWKMGLGLNLKDPTNSLRDLENPNSIKEVIPGPNGEPMEVSLPSHIRAKLSANGQACGPENDFCWVHLNATIPGHAMYQMVKMLGKEKAEKVVYQALTKRMTPRSNFRDTAVAMKGACRALYDEATCVNTDKAWAIVGL